jgi:ATP-binding cassette subfamily C protein CydC
MTTSAITFSRRAAAGRGPAGRADSRRAAERHIISGLGLAAIVGTLSAACSVALLALAAWLICHSAQHPLVLTLMAPAAVVQACGLGRAALRYAERLAGHDAALRLLSRSRTDSYKSLERLAPAGLAEFRSGDLIARLVSDVDSLADRWLRVRLPYLVAALAGTGAVAVSAMLLPAAGAVLAGTLLAAAVAAPVTAIAIARRAERCVAPLRGELTACTLDLLGGAGELAAFGAIGRVLAVAAEKESALAAATVRSGYARGTAAAVGVLAAGAAAWGGLVLGVLAARSGALAGVMLAVVVLMPLAAHEVFAGLPSAAQEIPRLRSAARRVAAVLDQPSPVAEPDEPAPLPGPPYDLVISGLSAHWPGSGRGVREVSLAVPAGSRVAIIGPSGSGKTTLAMVLLRFLDPASGSVTLGGTDITALDGDAVRTVIGLCAQDAHVFDSTLAANLRLARPSASDAQIRQALAGARLLDWADSLPQGLATPVGEHGARLSGGQRQRLALARVLLADFPVVIFDEPAEHLDADTAEKLTRDLLTATEGKTVLLITHRPVPPGPVDQELRLRLASGHVHGRPRPDG